MTAWKAGMLITAARLLDDTPTTTTSGIVAATGFTVTTFTGYRVGNTIELNANIQRTGADIPATTGNINDVQICTMPAGWRPTVGTTDFFWDSGFESGAFVMGTDGICTLRTATDNINTNANLRLHAVFIVDS
ncbi:hypothetical protein [Streptomyces sp. NPDC005970]|uniref:hypothetical protein n=1 Tax=Streptomyces sp. NPDC005970 TaxID=3156723 RepID=UPI0033C1157D